MRHPYFRTLLWGSLLASLIMASFLLLLWLVYENPIDNITKSFDFVLFIGCSIGTALYYKLKVNERKLSFAEGMVMITLVYTTMLLAHSLILAAMFALYPEKIVIIRQERLALLEAEKEYWLSKLQNPQDFDLLKEQVRQLRLGLLLWQETGLRLLVGFFTAIVGATGFRS